MADNFSLAFVCASCLCNDCTKRYRCSQCRGLAIKISYHTCLKCKCDRYEKETEKTPLHGKVPYGQALTGADIPIACGGCICTYCSSASLCQFCHETKEPSSYDCLKKDCPMMTEEEVEKV